MWNFTSGVVQNRKTKNRRLGMIVTSFQDFKLRGKQISLSFSYCELINSPRNGTKVHCLLENKKTSDSLKSWNDVTIIPSLLFLHPTESEISRFWYVKTGGRKIAMELFLAIFISTWQWHLVVSIAAGLLDVTQNGSRGKYWGWRENKTHWVLTIMTKIPEISVGIQMERFVSVSSDQNIRDHLWR